MKNIIDTIKRFLNPPKKTVLVIDDSEIDRTFVERVLSRKYHVVAAHTGREGIETTRRISPDLVLLDYMLPDILGPEVCRAIKNNPVTERIPVIFLTADGEATSMSDSFEEGADTYLTKPIDKYALLSQVAVYIREAETLTD